MDHLPVLYREALEALCIKKDGVYLDCTYGRGGHASGILELLGPHGRLIAFDRDPTAVLAAAELATQDSRFRIVHTAFSHLKIVPREPREPS